MLGESVLYVSANSFATDRKKWQIWKLLPLVSVPLMNVQNNISAAVNGRVQSGWLLLFYMGEVM